MHAGVLRWGKRLGLSALVGLSGYVIALTREPLEDACAAAELERGSYVLPGPDQALLFSLGYRDALADLLWAHAWVWAGQRLGKGQSFEFAGDYLDVITRLAPTFREPYDRGTLLFGVLSGNKLRQEDLLRAHALLARGVEQRPDDAALLASAAEELRYFLSPAVEDEALRAAWKAEAWTLLGRACELGGLEGRQDASSACLRATGKFNKELERDARIRALERAYMMSSEPVYRRDIEKRLWTLLDERERGRFESKRSRVVAIAETDLPFIGEDLRAVLPAPFHPERCAGLEAALIPDCGTTWALWFATPAETR